MTHRFLAVTLAIVAAAGWAGPALAADGPTYTHLEDVIYHRKHGTALTLDVFTPKKDANGAGVIFVVSGGWNSHHRSINAGFLRPLLDRGYTVFAVVHGSQPKFTLPEIIADLHRATRFIRHHAKRYAIDPDRIGITGGSAGGHLSLMQGTAGKPGDPDAEDPVDRASSRVQAVACFYPPTDFMNWGRPGYTLDKALANELKGFRPPFDVREFDEETKRFERVTDTKRFLEMARAVSPITHISEDDPPIFIMHGDADPLVPIQQARVFIDAAQKAGLTAELLVKEGGSHGWRGLDKDIAKFADWFDKHLK